MKIAIGSDHAGYERKEFIKNWLQNRGYSMDDKGTNGPDSVDYPDFAHPVAEAVGGSDSDLGVLICGSANGVAITANKHQKVRAAICWNPEIASLAKEHNDANICCIPARFVNEEETAAILAAYFDAEFEGGRHERRVNKMACQ